MRPQIKIFPWISSFLLSLAFLAAVHADTNIGGVINGDTTLTLANSPYIVTSNLSIGITDNGTPPLFATLTIEPGVIIKVNSGVSISIGYYNSLNGKVYYGRILANGTSTAPIQFLANSATPTQGYWGGIVLSNYQVQTSQFTYVSIKHASTGIYVDVAGQFPTLAPFVHHTTFEQNTKGMAINTGVTQVNMYQNNFISNGSGTNNYALTNTSNKTTLARFCWWNSATGPSLTGGGTAQRVTSNVIFEPYLINLASSIQYFTGAAVINKTFNPNINANFRLQFQTNQTGNWTVSFLNGTGQPVRTFTGTGSNSEVIWDGKDSNQTLLPNGNYSYQIDSIAGSDAATPGVGPVTIDTTKLLAITSFTAVDNTVNSFNFNAAANFDDPTWTLRFKNSSNVVVRTATGTNSPMAFTWDGKDDSNNPVPDGNYTAELQFAYGGVIATSTINLAIPAIAINSPTNGQVLSNVYNNGSFDFPVNITVPNNQLTTWTLEYRRTIPCCTSYTTAATGTAPKNNATVYTFQTLTFNVGDQYELRLTGRDAATNPVFTSNFVTIGNFKVTTSAAQFNPSQSGTVTYTTSIPFTLTETILIKNVSGQAVKTLIQNVSRPAGSYNDIWDGRNTSGQLLPDGPYFYVAQITVNGTPYTMDFTNTFPSSTATKLTASVSSTNDPFNNIPLLVNYTVAQASRIVICFAPTTGINCVPVGTNEFQMVQFEYQESGAKTYFWGGADLNGVFHPESKGVVVLSYPAAVNSVVVFGTKPVISNFSTSPMVFSPFKQSQNWAVNFSTYQSQSATVTLTFRNQQSASILRTIVLNGTPPGQTNVAWNGKADNGMWVSPGYYVVTITIQDSLGNSISRQLFTNVKY